MSRMETYTNNCRQLGDSFCWDRQWFTVVKADPNDRCLGCHFIGNPFCQAFELGQTLGHCCRRRGKCNVIFKKTTRPSFNNKK